ncbi:MAG: hypothetical protein IPJ77_05210 [Planctomycetes bacterium]|nr:hypothetical protein [Planctomycetota bacterium]
MLASCLFLGGTCEVGVRYCDEDCDPCFQVCHCRVTCAHALAADFEDAYGLRPHVVLLEHGDDGRWTRTHGALLGLALDRAFGPGEHDARAIELFARNVIRANPETFGVEREWSVLALERAGGGVVLTFGRSADADSALVFGFDRAGNLVEVVLHGRS